MSLAWGVGGVRRFNTSKGTQTVALNPGLVLLLTSCPGHQTPGGYLKAPSRCLKTSRPSPRTRGSAASMSPEDKSRSVPAKKRGGDRNPLSSFCTGRGEGLGTQRLHLCLNKQWRWFGNMLRHQEKGQRRANIRLDPVKTS